MGVKKYEIDTPENREFLKEQSVELLEFGRRFASPGGSAYYLGDDGTPWKDKNRETYETCRMAHVYSLGAFLGFAGSEQLIDEALKALRGELHDKEHGGWYAGLSPDDTFLPTKQ